MTKNDLIQWLGASLLIFMVLFLPVLLFGDTSSKKSETDEVFIDSVKQLDVEINRANIEYGEVVPLSYVVATNDIDKYIIEFNCFNDTDEAVEAFNFLKAEIIKESLKDGSVSHGLIEEGKGDSRFYNSYEININQRYIRIIRYIDTLYKVTIASENSTKEKMDMIYGLFDLGSLIDTPQP